MPYTVAWHPELSALVVRYEGSLSADEYRQMCAERAELLDKASADLAVVMDMQALHSFPEALSVGEEGDALQHENVREVLVVVDEALYEKIAGSVVPDAEGRWPLRFFPDVEQALVYLQRRHAQP